MPRIKAFVRIEIFDPIEDQSQLAQKVAAAYGLRDVCIANAPIEDEEEIKKIHRPARRRLCQ